MAEVGPEVAEAFRLLRPICVLISQNHDVESIENLESLLLKGTIADSALQEMHEYVAFPLRLILKQYPSDEEVCVKVLQCMKVLLTKTSIVKTTILLDLFGNILNFISAPPSKKSVSEEVRSAAVDAMLPLFTNCQVRCYCSLLKEALPMFGGLIAGLLDISCKEKLIGLRLKALRLLLTLLDHRQDSELKSLLERVVPSYLPGISLSLAKILGAHGEKAKILAKALELMSNVLVMSLTASTDPLPLSTFSGADVNKLLVEKTDSWYSQASKNLSLVIKTVAQSCLAHDSWLVRKEMVKWASSILLHCSQHLADCQTVLLDVLTHNMADSYTEVAECSQLSLTEVRARVHGVSQVLEQRLYDIATSLPRKVSRYDEGASLSTLKIFNGYLSALQADVVCLIRCHTHLQRIGMAFCQLLQLHCTGVNILDSCTSETNELPAAGQVFPVLRRQFLAFTDTLVWKEIQTSICTLVRYGDVYALVEYFSSEFQSNSNHRLQCALVLNEIINQYAPPSSQGADSKEVLDSCKAVLELYSDSYRQLLADSLFPQQLGIREKNEGAQLQCFILEGFVAIHQVTGSDYPELLLHSLYSMLESCAHDNILVKQTAVTGLSLISSAFGYSGSAELIEKHCNYLCNALSLNIRRLRRCPTSPSVLACLLLYSHKTVLPYVEHVILEVLYTLDEHYTDQALSLLRVPQMLVRQLCVWFPPPSLNADSSRPINCNIRPSDESTARDIYNYVKDYYETRLTADGFDFLSDTMEENPEQETEHVEEEDRKPFLPLYTQLTLKVVDRCKHLISHASPKIRLLTIDIISDACTVLSHFQNELLPAVHQIWAGFSKRFSDSEPLVVIEAIRCLHVLGDLAKDFVRVRVSKDVLPHLTRVLHKKASVSLNSGKAYRHTLDYKLQLAILETLGKLCVDLSLSSLIMEKVVNACLPYISCRQPIKLQQGAVASLRGLAGLDSDLVWYCTRHMTQDTDSPDNEFSVNLEEIFNQT